VSRESAASPEKLHPARPTTCSFGNIERRQQLSFESGVIRSEGKTQASSFADPATDRHASISASSPADNAACLVELSVFGVSSFRL
jgi:hypothetical protein